jgi:hypothetical protein
MVEQTKKQENSFPALFSRLQFSPKCKSRIPSSLLPKKISIFRRGAGFKNTDFLVN